MSLNSAHWTFKVSDTWLLSHLRFGVQIQLFSQAGSAEHFSEQFPFKCSVTHSVLDSVIVGQLISSPGDLAFPACITHPARCLSYCKCFVLTVNYPPKIVWLTPAWEWELGMAVGTWGSLCSRRQVWISVSGVFRYTTFQHFCTMYRHVTQTLLYVCFGCIWSISVIKVMIVAYTRLKT